MAEPDAMMRGTLGDFFSISREKGIGGLPTLSVTMYDGLVRRDSIDRKTDSELEDGEHLRVRPGDIAYNMMRMWQGASGLATEDGIVSPAYVVVRPKKMIDSLFASYWFKSERMIYLFWAYSYGLTNDRLRLYAKDFTQIPVELPALPQQQRIAQVLADFDGAIEATEDLVAAKQRRKRALIERLVSETNVKPVRLGKLGRFSKGQGIGKTDLRSTGMPCLRYAEIYTMYGDTVRELRSKVSLDVAASAARLLTGDIVFAGSGETALEIGKAVAYVGSQPAVVGGDTVILRGHGQDASFLAHALNSDQAIRQKYRLGQGFSVVHIHAGELAQIEVSLPPIERQQAISALLADLDNEVAGLVTKAAKLRQQRRGLMEKLLSGNSKHYGLVMEDVAV